MNSKNPQSELIKIESMQIRTVFYTIDSGLLHSNQSKLVKKSLLRKMTKD